MGIQTVYKCDRCNKSTISDGTLSVDAYARLELTYAYPLGHSKHPYPVRPAVLWCKDCCMELKVWVPTGTKLDSSASPLPTLEDLIREIARDEAQNVVMNGS